MSVFGSVLLATFSVLGLVLSVIEFLRISRAKKTSFICLCFREELLTGGLPDMLIICRTDAEQEEVIRRVCAEDSRKVYLKRW
jgi:hypothetical protein